MNIESLGELENDVFNIKPHEFDLISERMKKIFVLNKKVRTLKDILKEVKPGTYTLSEIHKITGWKYKQSVHRALKNLKYTRSHKLNKKINKVETIYKIG